MQNLQQDHRMLSNPPHRECPLQHGETWRFDPGCRSGKFVLGLTCLNRLLSGCVLRSTSNKSSSYFRAQSTKIKYKITSI